MFKTFFNKVRLSYDRTTNPNRVKVENLEWLDGPKYSGTISEFLNALGVNQNDLERDLAASKHYEPFQVRYEYLDQDLKVHPDETLKQMRRELENVEGCVRLIKQIHAEGKLARLAHNRGQEFCPGLWFVEVPCRTCGVNWTRTSTCGNCDLIETIEREVNKECV